MYSILLLEKTDLISNWPVVCLHEDICKHLEGFGTLIPILLLQQSDDAPLQDEPDRKITT